MPSRVRQLAFLICIVFLGSRSLTAQLRPETSPPPEKKPAAKPAKIIVETSPDAQVYLDDAFKGQASPEGRLVIENPKPGEHTLRISLTGRRNYEGKVTAEAGKEVTVAATLAPLAGSLAVETSPGAEVYLDDMYKGRAGPEGRLVIENPTPVEHSLRVTLPGKKDYEQKVTVKAGEAMRITATLVDLGGIVQIQTSPGAEVYLDNARRGVADSNGRIVLRDVTPGAHELRVTLAGKRDHEQRVTVVAGQTAAVTAALADLTAGGPVWLNPKDGLKHVRIPPGSFTMGCSPGDDKCREEENPPHQVTITRAFWMGQTEVTVAAYKRFAAATGRQLPVPPDFNSDWTKENMPIVKVTWDDAHDYCAWAGGRLPSEAEWEYAARAHTTDAHYGQLDEVAWYQKNSGAGTHGVGEKATNAFGLYDTLGNAWEWVNDWFAADYYQHSPSQDPVGPASGQMHVLRGGAWNNSPDGVRVTFRARANPGQIYPNYGFRCVANPGNP